MPTRREGDALEADGTGESSNVAGVETPPEAPAPEMPAAATSPQPTNALLVAPLGALPQAISVPVASDGGIATTPVGSIDTALAGISEAAPAAAASAVEAAVATELTQPRPTTPSGVPAEATSAPPASPATAASSLSANPIRPDAAQPANADQPMIVSEEPTAALPPVAPQVDAPRPQGRSETTAVAEAALGRTNDETPASRAPVAANQEALERLMVTNAVASDKDREQPIARSDAAPVERLEANGDKSSIAIAAAQRHAAAQQQADIAAPRPSGSVPAQLVQPMVRAIRNGAERIEIHLSPAELGRVDVKLDIAPDGRIQAVFAVDRPQTADLLQRDVRELARALQDAGLQTDSGSLSFNLRNQNQGHAHGWMANASQHAGTAPDRLEPERTIQYRPMIVSDDQVDIHV